MASLGLKFPYAILAAILSMSVIWFNFSFNSCLWIKLLTKSSTLSNLALISFSSCKGSESQFFNSLAPILVKVLSITQSKEPRFLRSLIVSIISRLRLVEASNFKYFCSSKSLILLIWAKLLFWVSARYIVNAPAAI